MHESSLNGKTKLHDLLKKHPFLLDFLAAYHPKFGLLRNAAMRATMGRFATLEKIAGLGGIPLQQLMRDLSERIASEPAQPPVAEGLAADSEPDPDKVGKLKTIIRALHDGQDTEALRAEFAELLADVQPEAIAAMEQELILEGMPVREIHRLCDLHVNVFRDGLESQEAVQAATGHPLHTYMAENRELVKAADRWAELCRGLPESDGIPAEMHEALDRLSQVEIHYVRKENQLFPYLEKHGFTGPSQVMWGLHDDVRGLLKKMRSALAAGEVEMLAGEGLELSRVIAEMIYKEEKILFPTAQRMLDTAEWRDIRRGDDEIGYALIPPPPPWSGTETSAPAEPKLTESGVDSVKLTTGELTLQQLDRLLLTMPVEFSFVDENDEVRYYSGHAERIFPRSPAVIGRKVQNCHPPHSVHKVNAILEAFKAGTKDRAEFWLQFKDKFLYVTYYPVRDEDGRYLGCLEATQDISRIRQLEGEQRLLDWDAPSRPGHA